MGSNVKPQAIDWLWPDWLARGKLHVLAGRPGALKTTSALGFGAVVTVGGQWPDGSPAAPGNVVMWSGEDAIDDTLGSPPHRCGRRSRSSGLHQRRRGRRKDARLRSGARHGRSRRRLRRARTRQPRHHRSDRRRGEGRQPQERRDLPRSATTRQPGGADAAQSFSACITSPSAARASTRSTACRDRWRSGPGRA